jgi:tripartite-type tricarboxylate transporter receptor subunit TctC
MNSISRRNMLLASAIGACLPAAQAQAQTAVDYPNRPIELVHGFGAGGNADQVARLIGQKLQESLKQPVVVVIRSGAGGSIATNAIAKAAPDGHKLLLLTGAHTVSAALRKDLPYDPLKDLSFVSGVTRFPFVVAVRTEHPARNLAQLIEISRKQPASFTSVGIGSTQHMVGELLGSAAGLKLLHVPYRGGAAPIQAVLGGEADLLVDTLSVALPHIQSGRLRALAVSSASPWPALPDVPPVAATLPGFDVHSWLALAAPAGTPEPVVKLLNSAVREVLQQAAVTRTLAGIGSLPAPSTPLALQQQIAGEIQRWREVVAQRGIQIE